MVLRARNTKTLLEFEPKSGLIYYSSSRFQLPINKWLIFFGLRPALIPYNNTGIGF